MLKGKTVLVGVSGSIAAYKTAYLASALKKLQADVHVLMTQNAVNFINPRSGERRCDRQDRPRHRGRHADDDGDGLQMQEDHCTGHEHQYVRESHRPGQSGDAAPLRVRGHQPGSGVSGVRGYGRGQDAGAGASAGIHPAGDRL